jgi:hypothetical protein|tara:strand:- start:5495 stop:6703 length:1209 start_codon:yes stop_codon:yes gene_type:complete
MNLKFLFLLGLLSCFSYGQCNDPVITNFECGMPTQTILGNGVSSVNNFISSGINMSNNIGEFIDDGTNGWDNLLIDYGTEIDLTANTFLSFKLYSSSSIQILAKLEGGTDVEVWSNFSSINTWEEFNFDFSGAVGNGNTSLVLFFNAAQTSGTTSDTYYIDDLQWTNTINSFPVISDFESLNPSFPLQGNIQKVSNPFYFGMNTSTNIGQYVDDGTNGWDNMQIDFITAVDISITPYFKIKLYTPSSIQILAKLEGGTELEVWSDFSSADTWEEFNFDFSSAANSGNTKLILFFNPGIDTGSTSDIYYIDDLNWSSTLSTQENDLLFSINVHPNPANSSLSINSNFKINSFILSDINGRTLIYEYNINKKSFKIDISSLKSGIYFLKNFSGKQLQTIKILKR